MRNSKAWPAWLCSWHSFNWVHQFLCNTWSYGLFAMTTTCPAPLIHSSDIREQTRQIYFSMAQPIALRMQLCYTSIPGGVMELLVEFCKSPGPNVRYIAEALQILHQTNPAPPVAILSIIINVAIYMHSCNVLLY